MGQKILIRMGRRRVGDDALGGIQPLACSNYIRHPSGKSVTQLPYGGRIFFERNGELAGGDHRLRR